jgi:molybdenum cofactor guanylyltransferase
MIAGLALAGGAARRMGGVDKTLLEIAGRPMLSYVLDRLRRETKSVAISANGDPARFAAFGLPVLSDGEFAACGPLAGVLAGLEWAALLQAGTLLTIPGDTPFVPAGAAATLTPAPACAAAGGRPQHLVALWPVTAGGALRDFLCGPGPYAAHRFAELIGMRVVPLAGADHQFRNINTPEDLAAARLSL